MSIGVELITLEDKLCKIANDINNAIGKNNSACSIYLYDYRRDKYVLRASTIETAYLGNDELEVSEFKKEQFDSDNNVNIGITVLSLLSKNTIISEKDINNDKRFSRYNKNNSEHWESTHFCEYPLENIGSVIVSPVIFKEDNSLKSAKHEIKIKHKKNITDYYNENDQLGGVIRVVRSKQKEENFDDYFDNDDAIKLENIILKNATRIESGVFVSQLIELGTFMDVSNLCKKAAQVFKNLLNCKGCSIFLLDEYASDKENKIYKCYGTTGLVKRQKSGIYKIDGALMNKEAWYIYEPNKSKEKTKPDLSLTVGVIRARMSAFVKNIYDQNEIKKQFPEELKITRSGGVGKVSEKFVVNDKYLSSRSILCSPMFFCDPNNKHVDVLGVVRVVRPDEGKDNPFTKEQIHLFVSLVERLSKAVLTAKLIHFFDDLLQIKDQEKLYEYVVSNIPKYIGASECAILINENNTLITHASWKNGETFLDNRRSYSYDLSSNKETGYTYYVGMHKQTIMFNGQEDLQKQFESNSCPSHNPKSGKEPYRYLGVPIDDMEGNLVAVIRICKAENTTRLTLEDKHMLERIANHLKSRIELFKQQKKKTIKIEKVFPKILQNQIESLSNVMCKDELANYFNDNKYTDSIGKSIIDFVPKLWEIYKPTFGQQPKESLKLFNLFNERILSKIPYYRDHFIHQFIVFLLGISIIDKFNLKEMYKNAYASDSDYFDENESEIAWFLSSMFHDVSYPLETVNKWFWNIMNVFVPESVNKRKTNIPIDIILFNADYIDSIHKLSDFHQNKLKRNDPNFWRTIINVLNNTTENKGLDHGIMTSLMLLSDRSFKINNILPIASAIALHNKLADDNNVDSISFERHPLAFLLIYCDLLHEWARVDEENMSEENIDYPNLISFEYAEKAIELSTYNSEIESLLTGNNLNTNNKTIFTEINLEKFAGEKINEARNRFNRLTSSNANFIMRINGELFVSKKIINE